MSMTPQDYRDLLERLEWTGSREGPGDGPMDSGPGRHYPACPYCGRLLPSPTSSRSQHELLFGRVDRRVYSGFGSLSFRPELEMI